MNFELNESQRLLQEAVRAFAAAEVAPHATKWDREERFPTEIIPKLAELGLLGMAAPEAYGGSGLDMTSVSVVIEEIARHDGSLALTIASHNGLASAHIARQGSDAQKRRWLPRLARGEALGAWCLTEPGSGSDAAGGMQTRAERRGGDWVLNGTKMFITQGSVGEIYVVLAQTGPHKQHGISAFVVERGTKGLSVGKHLEKLGMRSSDTTEVVLEDCVVPDENRLGDVDKGFQGALGILERGRISIASLALGIHRGALEEARKYALERIAFGKPIAENQAIQWMIADMATTYDASKLLVRRAAAMQDAGKRTPFEAAAAKLFASEAATRACDRAIQIFGGYGYIREFPVERYWRDAKLCEIGEGTSEIQRLVIARQILKVGLRV